MAGTVGWEFGTHVAMIFKQETNPALVTVAEIAGLSYYNALVDYFGQIKLVETLRRINDSQGSPPIEDQPTVARRMADNLFQAAMAAWQTHEQTLSPEQVEKTKEASPGWQVIVEYEALFLAVVDRPAWQMLGDQRAPFMDKLAGLVIDRTRDTLLTQQPAVEDTSSLVAKVNGWLYGVINDRFTQYGACRSLQPNKDEPSGGTVFWEFGLWVERAIGPDAVGGMLPSLTSSTARAYLGRIIKPRESLARLKPTP